ncbi:hypothetical protein ACMVZR_003797 [Vibrio parahaemolyticus]|uniref:hypothetical protein n=1 Tax=Vibrio parahaemolyticus TaxID=670 RepID=UPI0020B1505C|nr:hypothetical protein [Vibrio parahaemolyticus]MCR9821887.1 hypothetical protein [Vibrio parahaemolyticus]
MNTEELKKLRQEEKSLSAEEKLKKALCRLQNGKPLRTKAKGQLTLNKINNEAGLGRSYIHKFKDFVEKDAKPAIEEYNHALDELKKALERLLAGNPVRTKAKGQLTLNKINNEADLEQSYIHKFKDFVENVANPAIEKYNGSLGYSEQSEQMTSGSKDMSELDKLRAELNRERELKVEYRRERDEAIAINTELETLNKSLMFRVYELQEQLSAEVVEFEHHKK